MRQSLTRAPFADCFGTTVLVPTLSTMWKVTPAVPAKHLVRMVLRKVALPLADNSFIACLTGCLTVTGVTGQPVFQVICRIS